MTTYYTDDGVWLGAVFMLLAFAAGVMVGWAVGSVL